MITGLATRAQVKIEGTVQGVGFRPFVFRLARELDLTGWIVNGADGVMIEVEGAAEAVGRLIERLRTSLPAWRQGRTNQRSFGSSGWRPRVYDSAELRRRSKATCNFSGPGDLC